MKEYITFHQITFDKENLGVKKLFGLEKNICIGVQQTIGTFLRNPKNSNQIEIPEKVEIIEHEYNKFSNPNDAFEIIQNFIYAEFKIYEDDANFSEIKNKELYFNFFEQEEGETPKFRGVLHASMSSIKPAFYVAFTKSLEYEYERELYKK